MDSATDRIAGALVGVDRTGKCIRVFFSIHLRKGRTHHKAPDEIVQTNRR